MHRHDNVDTNFAPLGRPNVTAMASMEITISDRRWLRAIPRIRWRVARALSISAPFLDYPRKPNIVFESDRVVQRYNLAYRGLNKPTNILTFDGLNGLSDGDIILAYETTMREALTAKRQSSAHMTHLLVHGLLHLSGHDHHHVGDARLMEGLETKILARLGFANPWRAGAEINE